MNKLQYGSVPLVVFLLLAQLADMCWCESVKCIENCDSVTLRCEEGKLLTGIVAASYCPNGVLKEVSLKESTYCESQTNCYITRPAVINSLNCHRQGKKFDFEVKYECLDEDKSDISEQGDDSGGVDDNAGVGLIVALLVCGLVIVVLLSIIGVFLYRRHRYKRSLVKKSDSVIGSLRLDISNRSPSRDSSTYRRLPDSLTRQDSTYNSIPFDTDRTYSYAGLNSAVERESQVAGDKQAGSQIQNDGYTTLLKSDKPPVLPDRSNSEGSDYNDISDTKHVSAGDNTYSHGPSGNVEYDRIVRYPQPTLDENYTHFKCDANGTDSIRNDRVDVDQTSNGAQENNPNGPSNDSSRVILPIAVKGDASDSDVDDEQEDPTESKNTNDGYEDWVPGTAQDTAGDDDICAHMNTGGEIHTDGPATLEIECDYVIQRSDTVDTKDTNKLNKERDTQAQKPFMKRVDSYEHPETFVGV